MLRKITPNERDLLRRGSLNILIVEDQTGDLLTPYHSLLSLGHKVSLAFDVEKAIQRSLEVPIDLILLDWNLQFSSGETFLKACPKIFEFRGENFPQVILYTGERLDIERLVEKYRPYLVDCWAKPLTPSEFLLKLKALCERGDLQ